jgi:hypothetical protein
MEREVGSASYELPHEFEGTEGACGTCGQPESATIHHVERVTETAAATGPAVITEKGS